MLHIKVRHFAACALAFIVVPEPASESFHVVSDKKESLWTDPWQDKDCYIQLTQSRRRAEWSFIEP